MSWWKVKKELSHGGLIFGRRRTQGDTFEAPDSAMTFQAMEGIVEKTTAPVSAPAAAPAKAASQAAPDTGKPDTGKAA